jgi:uncharacterized protein YjeT (DUF2065 family)
VKSLQNAFRFINASIKLAFSHPQLRKSWWLYPAGGVLLLFLWLLPIGAVTAFISFSPIGLILIGAAGFFFIVSLYLWGEIVGLKFYQSAAEVISENAEEFTTSSNVIPSHWADVLLYTLTLPVLFLSQPFNNAQHTWLPGKVLMIPVISLEDLSLREALDRVAQITKDNLLRFRPRLVSVAFVARILQAILILGGVLLGVIAAQSIQSITTEPNLWLRLLSLLSIAAGMTIIWLMTTIGTLFSTYIRTCYHTALYVWVRNVEKARKTHNAQTASPPRILQQVLGPSRPSKKERKNGPKKRDPHLE